MKNGVRSGATGKVIAWLTRRPSATLPSSKAPLQWIDGAAARLGVDPTEYLTLSYGRLFDLWREQQHSPAQDLTFAAIAASGCSN